MAAGDVILTLDDGVGAASFVTAHPNDADNESVLRGVDDEAGG